MEQGNPRALSFHYQGAEWLETWRAGKAVRASLHRRKKRLRVLDAQGLPCATEADAIGLFLA